jgi:hypothetical protein
MGSLWNTKPGPLPPETDEALTKAIERLKNMTPEEADALYQKIRASVRPRHRNRWWP